jgi:hypothetical protein
MSPTVDSLPRCAPPRHPARLVLALLPLLLGGCATLFTGTTDRLSFDADVPGVRLSVDGHYQGELPLAVEMPRGFIGGQQFIATFEKPGFQTQEFKLLRDFNVVAILDISSPITSGGVDILTGAMVRFSPTAYHLQMVPAGNDPGATSSLRRLERHRFALANHRELQRDLARGGGDHLTAYTSLLASGDEVTSRRLASAACRATPGLLAMASAPAFAERLDRLLEEQLVPSGLSR